MRTRHLSIALLVLFSGFASCVIAVDVPTGKGQCFRKIIGECNNVPQYCWCCPDSTSEKSCDPQSICTDSSYPVGSMVDHTSFNYIHDAYDYVIDQATSGCSTCGGNASMAPKLDEQIRPLVLKRIHRFREMSERSSFGPGVFMSYDISLHVMKRDDGSWQVTVMDPGNRSRLLLTDAGSGVFKGLSGNVINGLRFYTGASGSGSVTADPTLATSAVLTTLGGYRYTFELFDPHGSLPSPWKWGDIGSPGSHGSISYTNSTFYLSAGGTDIWDTSDAFGYVYQAMTGDCSITAHVGSLATYRGLAADGSNQWAKAGVMIREGLDANARCVNMFVTPSNGACYQSRMSSGASMVHDGQVSSITAPQWVKLVRSGSTITGSISSDGSTWTTVATKTVSLNTIVYIGLSLTSHSSEVLSDASYDNVSVTGTTVSSGSWPTPTTAPYTTADLSGRLTAITDRNSYATTIAYKTWTSTQLSAAPDLKWQIDTIADGHGRTLTFHYASSPVSGRWVVDQVTLPNSQTVTYSYTGGLLTGVAYSADSSSPSTFSYTWDSDSDCTAVSYDDSGAGTTHRRKTAYLTNDFVGLSLNNRDQYQTFNQASNLVRMVVNGSGEVAYLSIPVDSLTWDIYEGGGTMCRFTKLANAFTFKFYTSWSLDTVNGGVTGGTFEPTYDSFSFASEDFYRIGSANSFTDKTGVTRTYVNDSDGYPTEIDYSDGTTEVFAYNAFKQKTRHKDRLNRVELWTYDNGGTLVNGNLTKHEVGIVFNPSTSTDGHVTGEYAHEDWVYNTSGTEIGLLHSYSDFNGNTTTYTYTSPSGASQHLVASVTTPTDDGTSTILAWQFQYDSYGRRTHVIDAGSDIGVTGGRDVQLDYDNRDRLWKTTYPDTSTEITVFGTGTDKNLVVLKKDRQGEVTEFVHDAHGRVTDTWMGRKTMAATGGSTTDVSSTTVTNESLASHEVCTYLSGTNLKASCTLNNKETDYTYDYRLRLATVSTHPTTSTTLTTTNLYVNNLLRQVTDPYGRKTYYAYRSSDAKLIRTVRGLVPSDGLTDYAAAATASRPSGSNPNYTVTSMEGNNGTPSDPSDDDLDPEGQVRRLTDPRGIVTYSEFDSRGRLTARTEAYGDTTAGRTEYVYDSQGNITQIHTPRWSVSSDSNGYGNAWVRQTWSARNLLLENKEAPGTGVAGAEDYTYYDDGRLSTTTDRRGKVWQTTWGACCGRIQGRIEPLVGLPDPASNTNPARITRHNDSGDLTHEAVVNEYSTTTFPSYAYPANQTDVSDSDTVTETTTAYDHRHRRRARTVWLSPRGTVDANNPPIAGEGGISSSAGLTTRWRYDDDLTDTNGLSSSSDPDSVYPYLSGLNLGTGAAGSAIVEINPAGEHRWTIFDGTGRVIRVVDGNGNATTTAYDTVTGGLLDTAVTDALSHTTHTQADAASMARVTLDAASNATNRGFDANGNLVSLSDPNSVGVTAVFDARNRMTSRTDTHSDSESWTYDKNSNVLTYTDQRSKVISYTYDARDRKSTVTDRVSGVTTFAYDPNSNLLSIMDADGAARGDTTPTTQYTYDARSTLASETFQRASSTSDTRVWKIDAARRLRRRQDQAGVTTIYNYDMASRLTSRTYTDSPSSGSWSDTFAYDAASRLTSATCGRYGNTVTRDYSTGSELAGRLKGESLTLAGRTYSVSYGYDAANRETSITYPNGKVVARTYTSRDQLATVSYDGTQVADRSSGYDAGMRLTSTSLHNGLTETRSYRTDNLVSSIAVSGVTNFGYTYDAAKRKTQETAYLTADTQNFGYDDEARLTSWNRNTSSQDKNWTLSKVGDMTTITTTYPSSTTDTRTYDNTHQVLTDNPGTSASLGQDAKGNLTLDQNGQTLAWDDENRLHEATSGSSNAAYGYDALGRRVLKLPTASTSSLVGLWRFDENGGTSASDATGTNSAATMTNGATFATGLLGSGASLDGTNDYIDLGTGSSLSFGSGTAFTIAAWVKTTDNAGLVVSFRSNTDDGAVVDLAIGFDGITTNNGHIMALIRQNGGGGGYAHVVGGTVNDGAWHHVALTRTTGGTLQLYLDGTSQGTASGSESGGAITTNQRAVGCERRWVDVGNGTADQQYLGGTVDDVRVYTRQLSTSEVTAIATNTIFVHAGAQVVSEYSQVGGPPANTATPTLSYVYGSYVDEPLALISGSSRYYYHANHLYGVAALTDSSGAVVERYRYGPYDDRTVMNGSGTVISASAYGQQYGITGRYHDDETGLVYFRTRQYSPTLGRFISRDPFQENDDLPSALDGYPDGMSLYAAYLIPNEIDPMGMAEPPGVPPGPIWPGLPPGINPNSIDQLIGIGNGPGGENILKEYYKWARKTGNTELAKKIQEAQKRSGGRNKGKRKPGSGHYSILVGAMLAAEALNNAAECCDKEKLKEEAQDYKDAVAKHDRDDMERHAALLVQEAQKCSTAQDWLALYKYKDLIDAADEEWGTGENSDTSGTHNGPAAGK